MSSKKKKVVVNRPIDAVRELFEVQQLQIVDLTEILKKQSQEIRTLYQLLKSQETIEKERLEKQKAENASWFFASRSSE